VRINPVIAGLTFRQALARRRWIIVSVLAALPIVMAVLIRIYAETDEKSLADIASLLPALSLTVVVPIIALVLASAGFGAEVDDGTVVYLLTKPTPRSEIVITKFTVIAAICVAISFVSTGVAGAIAIGGLDSTGLVLGFGIGAALGSVLYTAVFMALGLITRRGLLVGLVYLVVWEGTFARFFAGTRNLSIRQYMLSVADAVSRVDASVFEAQLPVARAYWMSGVILLGAVALCITKLRTFEIGQAS
jgi:ABC-2 type transport system permease protein